MATTSKPKLKKSPKVPPPGRKMNKKEARDYAFRTYGETMALLAKKK